MLADEAAQNNNSEATMPRTGRSSSEVAAGSIEEKLVALKLSAGDPEQTKKIDRVLSILQGTCVMPSAWQELLCCLAHRVRTLSPASYLRQLIVHCRCLLH